MKRSIGLAVRAAIVVAVSEILLACVFALPFGGEYDFLGLKRIYLLGLSLASFMGVFLGSILVLDDLSDGNRSGTEETVAGWLVSATLLIVSIKLLI